MLVAPKGPNELDKRDPFLEVSTYNVDNTEALRPFNL